MNNTEKLFKGEFTIHKSECWLFSDAVVGDQIAKVEIEDVIVLGVEGDFYRVKRVENEKTS